MVMKKTTQVLLILLFFVSTSTNAQRIVRTTTEGGSVYPQITATNIAEMFTMTMSDWERGMKLMTKVRDDFGEMGISYTCESKSSDDGFCFVTKKSDELELVYNLGANKQHIFTKLLSDLEKDYVSEVDGYKVYEFEHTDAIDYVFLIKITDESDYVKVYQSNLKK